MKIIHAIWRGMGYVEDYGTHPGTVFAFFLPVAGAIAGMPDKWLFGFSVMALIFWPFYLYGAYERGKVRADSRSREE